MFKLADRWDNSRSEETKSLKFKHTDIEGWNTNQLSKKSKWHLRSYTDLKFAVVVFLERLEATTPLPTSHVHALTDAYKFNSTKNAEVGLRWFELALVSPAAKDFAQSAADWVVAPEALKGRMKFCRPVFRLLNKVDSDLAAKTFEKNKLSFHPIARKLIAKASSNQQRSQT
jgi:leukotriene-A4 hydrolase